MNRADTSACSHRDMEIEPKEGSETCSPQLQAQEGSHSLSNNPLRPSIRSKTVLSTNDALPQPQTHVKSDISNYEIFADLLKRHHKCLQEIESCKTLYIQIATEQSGTPKPSSVRRSLLKEQANAVLRELVQWQEEYEQVWAIAGK